MQITIEDISPVEKRVEFELPWSEVAPRLDGAYNKLRREVRLRGFRPGKAPRPVLERLYRHDVEHDVARALVELSLDQAVRDKQIDPIAPPTVDSLTIKDGEPFKFSARVEVRSQVTPKDYTGIPLGRRPPRTTDEQVSQALEQARRNLTQFVPVEGRTVAGDRDVLVAEVHGKIGEHKIKKSTVAVDLADEVGGPLPGLGKHLRGVVIDGSHRELKYTIPEDHSIKELAGKPVSLHVHIKEVRERREPVLDDEFAKDTGEADTLAGLKEKIRERLLETDKLKIKRELQGQLAKEIVKRNPFAIARSLVDRYADGIVARARQQLVMMGIDPEAVGGIDVAAMKKEFAAEAEEEARASILIAAIAEREAIEVSDADLQKHIAELAAARQENPKKLRAEIERAGRLPSLQAQIREEKVLDKLLADAKITDEDPARLILSPDEAKAADAKAADAKAAGTQTKGKPSQ